MRFNNSCEFTDFVGKTHHIVLSAVRKHLFAEYYSSIDDVVQETYTRAYIALNSGQLKEPEKINSWLYVIAKNESIRLNKKYFKEKNIEKKYSDFKEDEESVLVERDKDAILFDEIKKDSERIPGRYREVFSLFLDGKTEAAISAELKIPKGTVKSRLHRAKNFICRIFSNKEV